MAFRRNALAGQVVVMVAVGTDWAMTGPAMVGRGAGGAFFGLVAN